MAMKLLREPAVLSRIPFSKSTLHRRVKDGSFPSPIRVSERAVAWRESDIEAWEASLPVVQPRDEANQAA